MTDLAKRLKRLTQELRALRLQLHWSNFQSSSVNDHGKLLDHLVTTGMVEDLKDLTDQISGFLWSYIDQAAENTTPDVDFAAQSKQLAQVTELLRTLRQTSCPAADQLGFVARVTLSVDQHLNTTPERPKLALVRSA